MLSASRPGSFTYNESATGLHWKGVWEVDFPLIPVMCVYALWFPRILYPEMYQSLTDSLYLHVSNAGKTQNQGAL
jgi:hypothetical protein